MKRSIPWICSLFAALTAIYPFTRAFYHTELSYNEGWNIYNASAVANHQLLYPARYGWTTVNYPMLSFWIMAQLHRLTHEYLFTARIVSMLSLVACCILVGFIVKKLTDAPRASWLAGFFCLAIFCTSADGYIGVDDPQMLALAFFLAGLLLYVQLRERLPALAIAGAAGVFIIAACVKHNPIDFPLAVLLDLAFLSRRRALWFSVCMIVFAAAAVALNIHYGGPYFLSQLFTPRGYSLSKGLIQAKDVLGPLLLPLCVAGYTAFAIFKDEKKRIAAIFLGTSLAVSIYTSGGQGVSVNSHFSALLAISILIGVFFDEAAAAQWAWPTTWLRTNAANGAPLLLFAWFIIPAIVWGVWNPVQCLQRTAASQKRFDTGVALLRGQNGPVLCESLLRCYFAGKPYLYDPFNSTRLIQFGKLDADVPANAIRLQQDAAIQLSSPLPHEYALERFNPGMLDMIQQNYVPVLAQEDAVIYMPKVRSEYGQTAQKPDYRQTAHGKVDYKFASPHHRPPKTSATTS
jgi:hypothetical protein